MQRGTLMKIQTQAQPFK